MNVLSIIIFRYFLFAILFYKKNFWLITKLVHFNGVECDISVQVYSMYWWNRVINIFDWCFFIIKALELLSFPRKHVPVTVNYSHPPVLCSTKNISSNQMWFGTCHPIQSPPPVSGNYLSVFRWAFIIFHIWEVHMAFVFLCLVCFSIL